MQKNREKSLEMKSEGFFGRLVGENVNSARSNNLVLKYQRFTPSIVKIYELEYLNIFQVEQGK